MSNEVVELGDRVKDKVTGFVGVATAEVRYLNKCVQYCVEARVGKDNKKPETAYIDIDQLVVLKKNAVEIETEPSGGPMPNQPTGLHP